jgi:peptidoglycan/xylan/chitin deacetylase (PgdA/CDA1 family)
MSLVSLMYHDVLSGDRWDESGFPGSAAAHYKLGATNFLGHLDSLVAAGLFFPKPDAIAAGNYEGCLLTFDDGGASAPWIGEALRRRGMGGCFFITTARIGTRGFVSAHDLRAMRADGHLVGSHSHTHPANIAQLDTRALHREWRQSVDVLEQLLGEPVHTASVPGGFMSPEVWRAAEACGIRTLFTSEPSTSVQRRGACAVLGRYALLRTSPPAMAVALATGRGPARLQQWTSWNVKKPLKRWAGPVYRFTRARLLRHRDEALRAGSSSCGDFGKPGRE